MLNSKDINEFSTPRAYLWPLRITLLLKEQSINECISCNFMTFLAMCSHLATSTPKVHYLIRPNYIHNVDVYLVLYNKKFYQIMHIMKIIIIIIITINS